MLSPIVGLGQTDKWEAVATSRRNSLVKLSNYWLAKMRYWLLIFGALLALAGCAEAPADMGPWAAFRPPEVAIGGG
jgi:hypothetical protein